MFSFLCFDTLSKEKLSETIFLIENEKKNKKMGRDFGTFLLYAFWRPESNDKQPQRSTALASAAKYFKTQMFTQSYIHQIWK